MEIINMNLRKNVRFWKNNIMFASNCLRNYCKNRTEAASYPEIVDTSFLARKQQEKDKWHEKIKSLSTVEEKLIEVNMPAYYGLRCLNLTEGTIPYNSLNFTQSITRTFFMQEDDDVSEENSSPESTNNSQVFNALKPLVIDLLLFHHHGSRFSPDDECEPGSSIVKHLNTLIMAHLAKDAPHLMGAEVDYNPRIEAYWVAGGMEPTFATLKARKNLSWMKDYANMPEDRYIQYVGNPVLQLRYTEPLQPRSEFDTSKNAEQSIPFFKFDPRVLGLELQRRHGTNIPGFWPGDPCEFSLMSYHLCNHLKNRPETYGSDEHAEALHCQAILASFSWLLPLVCYQGFSPFQDVTYPLLTQTVLTDGQFWSFYTYQLNTNNMSTINVKDNLRYNMCWGTQSMKLFDGIEDGKIIGFNDRVLKILLNMYLNKPCKRDIQMKPYLGEHPRVADIPDEEKRMWLETRFKHLYSLRPRHRPLPEVYHWEKIYKIDHKTRQMEPRRRPFELGVNPFKRRLDEHQPAYIPKALRTDKKKKWAKTYYPK